jgi:hypothetical protein
MTPRAAGRTATCNRADAAVRLRHAESFLVVADLVLEQSDDPMLALTSVAGSLAVLAGIAAADAGCCAALGRRARGQRHDEAIPLVRTIQPDGPVRRSGPVAGACPVGGWLGSADRRGSAGRGRSGRLRRTSPAAGQRVHELTPAGPGVDGAPI